MIRLGIFARTFARPTVEEVFDAVVAHGLHCVQFNLSCAGVPTLPDEIAPELIERIHRAALDRGIEIAAISGTYNMIHPDPQVRQRGLDRLRVLAATCRDLGTEIITLCPGTRDPADMWRWHPDNASSQAWSDLLQVMEAALEIAEQERVTLAFEPERANVVNSALRGRELLDALPSPRLKVVIDPANLIVPAEVPQMRQVMSEAFELLGEHIVIAHAKDRGTDDTFRAAGEGIVDYDHYLSLLQGIGFSGPLIIHGLAETGVDRAVRFLASKLQERL